jgi:hypothetical protein
VPATEVIAPGASSASNSSSSSISVKQALSAITEGDEQVSAAATESKTGEGKG